MKKHITIGILIILSSLLAYPQAKVLNFGNGLSSKQNEIKTPQLIINESKNYIDVSYSFTEAEVSNIKIENNTYQSINISGFSYMSEVGKPSLPAHNDIIVIPDTNNIYIEIIDSEYREFDNYIISPVQQLHRDCIGDDDITPICIDSKAYSLNQFYPNKIVDIVSIQDYRETNFAMVQIRPIQYNPVTKKIRCYSKINYRINYNNNKLKVNDSSVKLLSNISLNKSYVEESLSSKSMVQNEISTLSLSTHTNYYIFTTEKFLPAVEKLALWKTMTGNKAYIQTSSSWTSSQINSYIKLVYFFSNPKPEYFLIVGDHEDVPSYVYNDSYPSDLYYVCMGGENDFTADMAFGRIPVSTLQEAEIVIEKIINYEKNPPSLASFYKTALHCAQFQDDNLDGYADRRFTHTSEEIRDYMLTQNKTINYVYNTTAETYPRYYNKGGYSNGQPIREDLRKDIYPYYPWNGSAADIVREINQGRFYVLHRDHGSKWRWGRPPFGPENVDQLTNGNLTPVVFSINCSTGSYQEDECLAEKFLRRANGGAVGVFAPSAVSYSGLNDALIVGCFDAIWSDPGISPRIGSRTYVPPTQHEPIYQMGKVLTHGLLRMAQTYYSDTYTNKIFHYFGDPSMEIYTQKPSTFNNVSITQNGTNVTVSCPTNAKITLISASDMGTSYYKSVNGASYTFTDVSGPYYVTVTKHNYIPYVYLTDLYIQNEILSNRKSIRANNIYIGRQVTNTKPNGDVKITSGSNIEFNPEGIIVFEKGFSIEHGSSFSVNK